MKRVFGYPGDGINGLIGALDRAGDAFDFVQVRHEEMAAFMASAHAKFTGEVGVCIATSGPGAIHLLNGLYDARMDHMPVLAIVGQQARAAIGGHYQQEVDLHTLFKDVAGAFVAAGDSARAGAASDRPRHAHRASRAQGHLHHPPERSAGAGRGRRRRRASMARCIPASVYASASVIPEERDLRRAADVLNAGKKVAMLVGAGALHATDEVIAVAEKLGAGVAKALLGKAAVPDDLPFVTGSIGLLGTKPSWDMMTGLRHAADGRLAASPIREFLPKQGAGARRADRYRRPTCSACAIRWR